MTDPLRRRMLGAVPAWLATGAATRTSPSEAADVAPPRAPLRVVASFSIVADIARNVAGPLVSVEPLVGPDGDAHAYEPTPADARRLARAELVVTSGLGFEGWLPRLVAASGYRGAIVVASDGIAALRRGDAVDPHVWQDLGHGARMATTIGAAMESARPEGRDGIRARTERYVASLQVADRTIRDRFAAIPRQLRRVVTSHDAFAYFGAAYGVDFLAPLGTAAESEPSAATVARFVARLRAQAVRAVFVENIADPRLVERIAKEANAAVGGKLYSDALSRPGGEADTYLKLVGHNAAAIASALTAAPGGTRPS